MPAADVESAVLDQVQKLLAAPEIVARTWSATKRDSHNKITEREVTVLLAEFAAVWNELFPAEQARIVQLLSSGSTSKRTRSRCGSGPTGWQLWSGNRSTAMCGRRGRRDARCPDPARWHDTGHPDSDAVSGSRRPQPDRGTR
jgi:hypothetical protein